MGRTLSAVRLVGATCFFVAGAASADAVLEARYVDPEGFGFNDEMPVDPVPGNPAETLGGQRRHVLEAAIDIFATYIDSDVPIRVAASFRDFGCQDDEDAVLARGGAFYSSIDFEGAPLRNTWYPGALATHLAGAPVDPGHLEARVHFNPRPDEDSDCFSSLPGGYWYGIGEVAPSEPVATPFIRLALHELGHAMGILTFVDEETGELPGDPPETDIYSRYVYSPVLGKTWNRMTNEERLETGSDGQPLTWSGTSGNRWAREVLLPPAEIRVEPPVEGRKAFPAHLHGRRPFPPPSGLEAALVVAENSVDEVGIDGVDDEPRRREDACQPLHNREATDGSILFAVRGGCHFATKWRHAQQAGSVGLVVADRYSASHERAMNRDQHIRLPPHARIPLWTVSRDAGQRILASPPERVTLAYDDDSPQRGTHDERVALETNWPGSNVSHVSRSTVPATFMATGGGMHQSLHDGQVDMVPGMLYDIGWTALHGKESQWTGNWFDPNRAGEGCQLTLEGNGWRWTLACYTYREGRQIWLIGTTMRQSGWLRFDEMYMTRGTGYGPEFDADEVETLDWGRIDVQLVDCNTALFNFVPTTEGFEPMARRYSKVVGGDCRKPADAHPDRGLSGNFYNPERSGEGVQLVVESDGETVIMAWYSYYEGRQLWAIGAGHYEPAAGRVVVDSLHVTRGGEFGTAFDPGQVEVIRFGSATMSFDGCNDAKLHIESALDKFPDVTQQVTRIVPSDCDSAGS